MVARQCVLAWIGYVNVLYRHLVVLHRYAFFGFVSISEKNATKHPMRCLIMHGSRYFVRRSQT